MEKRITCFIPFSDKESIRYTASSFKNSGLVDRIYVLNPDTSESELTDVNFIKTDGIASTISVRKISETAKTDFILLYNKTSGLDLGKHALERMIQVCEDTNAGIVYSGYYENKDSRLSPHPVIDYQEGSLRDDFNFGSVILYRTKAFTEAVDLMKSEYKFAGLYDLRLKISVKYRIVHIPELLYTEFEADNRKTGEKQFDYVDPKNRSVQIEMENACTGYLKDVNAWLKPEFSKISFDAVHFENEASVIIPVKNRVKTISDAIESVLSQKTPFKFNLIVVDNYSGDGTTEIIRSFAEKDKRVIHVIPDRKDLGIGGCWNEGIFNDSCGKFAIQLDSDDLYIDNHVISRIVEAFYDQKCAMVVGSYKMVNFNLQDIPPGLIDHKEWTPENGRNNALRINGLGAPRAFYTPVLRSIRVPNVSYGEDYAVGLAICRKYQIGRIMEPLYLCRRWDENSDAALDINKANTYNFYKDRIRTIEFLARKQFVSSNKDL